VSRTSTGSSSVRDPARRAVVDQLQAAGVRPQRELGQSFLIDPFVPDAEAALVEVPPGAAVVEIGPGLGAFTEALLRRGIGPLTVIEKDRRLVAHLRRTFGDRIRVLEGDARTLELPEAAAVVGNFPFSVGTPLLVRLLKARVPVIVALLQAEVAERLLAEPGSGSYGRLTLLAQLHADVEGFLPVPSEAFEPVPAVAGRVVRLTHRPGPLPVPDEDRFEALTRALFTARRKQLKNLLPGAVPPGRDPDGLAAAAEWPSDWRTRRPEELPPAAYFRLATVLGDGSRSPA
jgi:16S rRNA (adenine1518-N6/adenine1519-N6)-dimethyltransferase